MQTLSPTNLVAIADTVVHSLSSEILQASIRADLSVTELVLASVVKLLCVSPSSFRNVDLLVTGTLRAFATLGAPRQSCEVACKLLALQALATVAQMGQIPDVLKTIRPAVVSILGSASNHPSALLRIAAVEVRNAWFVME